MRKKIIRAIIGILFIILLMYVEYRYIMLNAKPYVDEDNVVYIEVLGQVDEYYAESIKE